MCIIHYKYIIYISRKKNSRNEKVNVSIIQQMNENFLSHPYHLLIFLRNLGKKNNLQDKYFPPRSPCIFSAQAKLHRPEKINFLFDKAHQ